MQGPEMSTDERLKKVMLDGLERGEALCALPRSQRLHFDARAGITGTESEMKGKDSLLCLLQEEEREDYTENACVVDGMTGSPFKVSVVHAEECKDRCLQGTS